MDRNGPRASGDVDELGACPSGRRRSCLWAWLSSTHRTALATGSSWPLLAIDRPTLAQSLNCSGVNLARASHVGGEIGGPAPSMSCGGLRSSATRYSLACSRSRTLPASSAARFSAARRALCSLSRAVARFSLFSLTAFARFALNAAAVSGRPVGAPIFSLSVGVGFGFRHVPVTT